MKNNILNNKYLLLFSSSIIIIFLILILLSFNSKSKEEILFIDNFNNFIIDVDISRKDDIQEDLYTYIIKQNEINNKENKTIYHGNIRENTIQTSDNDNIYSTEFILDIPELQYSYLTQFSWVNKNNDNLDPNLELGPISIYCLSNEDSIYPDFNCDQNPAISKKTDSLLSIDMIIDENCWMSPFVSTTSKSGYGVEILYHPIESDYKNNSINSSHKNCEKKAKDYLSSKNLSLKDYEIKTTTKYLYNY